MKILILKTISEIVGSLGLLIVSSASGYVSMRISGLLWDESGLLGAHWLLWGLWVIASLACLVSLGAAITEIVIPAKRALDRYIEALIKKSE